MIKVLVQSGPHPPSVFVPPPGATVALGRGMECFVRIDDHKASRKHAVLLPRGNGYIVRDEGSRNGTLVNGKRVQEAPLSSGDTIRIGDTELTYVREEDEPWLGKMVAGYQIMGLLGKGGMGTVYRAYQTSMERWVAVKILSEELSGNEEFVKRFVEEARSMAKVSHPHVVQVHNVGQHGTVYYLSMEYLEGGSAKDLVDREGPVPPQRAASMALDATRALMWARRRKIVHRDIKPANLLLDSGGRVKVADFGLATDLQRSKEAGASGNVLGSPHFMAPEQAKGLKADHRADIYALGSTLYTLVSGKHPFPGKTLREILVAKLQGEPVPLQSAAPKVPRRLGDVIRRAMQREPEDRYQEATELHEALVGVLSGLEGEAGVSRPPSTRSPGKGPFRRGPGRTRTRNGKALLAAGCIGAAAVIAGVLWLLASRSPTRDGREDLAAGGTPPAPAPDIATPPAQPRPEPVPTAATEPQARRQPEPAGKTARKDGAPPADPAEEAARAFQTLVDGSIRLLLLESRFDKAASILEDFRTKSPASAPLVDEELRVVDAARRLFEARKQAISLQAKGKPEAAAAVLEEAAGNLPEPYRGEARIAIESLEKERRDFK